MSSSKRPRPEAIDWPQVRKRLARAIAATEETLRLSPQRARAILDERARLLARVPVQETRAEGLEVVVFTLADERYGIETRHVREVVRLTNFTPLPGAPEFLAGIINLRGSILAVLDLGKFFGLAVPGLSDRTRVIVLGEERAEFGVLAEAANEVVTLRADALREPPDSVTGSAREYLRGVTADALLVLDGAVLLADPRLTIDQSEENP
jgi:purine-binding chemotaxis protein CheW